MNAMQLVINIAIGVSGPLIVVGMFWLINVLERNQKRVSSNVDLAKAVKEVWKAMPDSCKNELMKQSPVAYRTIMKQVVKAR